MNTPKTNRLNPALLRDDFPVLNQKIHRDRQLIYFDNGASTQRPQAVIDSMSDCYKRSYANVHRGIHWLSERASAQYEHARNTVQQFINAEYENEVIFTSGTTEGVNLVARSWGDENVQPGDEILLTLFEHHSNIVPWQQLAQRSGALVKFAGITPTGELDLDDFNAKLSERTKVVSISAVSNVLGCKVPVSTIVEQARAVDALTFVDAAQHVPHEPTDVRAWGADFVTFSGHKMLGPSGIGVLWGRQSILEAMPPFMGGGSMIDQVTVDGFTPGELPAKFEAGTPPIVEAIGLASAIQYLLPLELSAISRHEHELTDAVFKVLGSIDGLTILGPPEDQRSGLVSFVIEGVSAQDLSILLDQQGIAIRAGHHCAMPLHKALGHRASCRVSFYLYNTLDEIDQFGQSLVKVIGKLR